MKHVILKVPAIFGPVFVTICSFFIAYAVFEISVICITIIVLYGANAIYLSVCEISLENIILLGNQFSLAVFLICHPGSFIFASIHVRVNSLSLALFVLERAAKFFAILIFYHAAHAHSLLQLALELFAGIERKLSLPMWKSVLHRADVVPPIE